MSIGAYYCAAEVGQHISARCAEQNCIAYVIALHVHGVVCVYRACLCILHCKIFFGQAMFVH